MLSQVVRKVAAAMLEYAFNPGEPDRFFSSSTFSVAASMANIVAGVTESARAHSYIFS